MYDRLQSLPLSWHTEHHSGNLIDRINVAARALHEFGVCQDNYVAVFMKFWGPLIILWRISPPISAASLLVGVLMVAVTRRLYHAIVPLYRKQIETLHDFAAAFLDYMSNMRTIITLRLGRHAKRDLDDRLARFYPYMMGEHNVTQLKCFVMALLVLLLEVGVIFYYIWAQQRAGAVIMIGSVTAIFQYLGQLLEAFQFYAGDYEQVLHWRTDFEAVRPVLESEGRALPEDSGLRDWEHLVVQPIRFSHGNGKLHLRDVSLSLSRHGKIALVGESGAGKSTLLQVLRGLSDVPDASLIVDGNQTLPLSALSSTATLIPQEPEIFENTIRHNITMGIPATDEEIQHAIGVAAFDQVIECLPNGLDSDIREKGVNLSGGERQRLALARGVFAIRDSSLVLLDEPTSNIDPGTEAMIFDRLFRLLAERCVVSALHRLHLLRLFDYVYVMKQGQVVEEGAFADLCGRGGEFARLWVAYQAETKQAEATTQLPGQPTPHGDGRYET
jgi:ABC-type multidrug transport system fused ATPase/permease subunit